MVVTPFYSHTTKKQRDLPLLILFSYGRDGQCLFPDLLTALIPDRAGCLARGLAGCLALAAAAFLHGIL